MKKQSIIAFLSSLLLFCFVLFPAHLGAEQEDLIALREEIASLRTKQDGVRAKRDRAIVRSDSLAHQIEELKAAAKKGMGIVGEYELEGKLREAQLVTRQIEAFEREIDEIEDEMARKKVELSVQYDRAIAEGISRFESISDKKAKRALLLEIGEYRAEKARLGVDALPEQTPVSVDIHIDPDDTPEEIAEKADLFRDLADKITRRVRRIEKRMENLEEEQETRRKMREFVEETFFFDEDLIESRVVRVEQKPSEDGEVLEGGLVQEEAREEVFAPPGASESRDALREVKALDAAHDSEVRTEPEVPPPSESVPDRGPSGVFRSGWAADRDEGAKARGADLYADEIDQELERLKRERLRLIERSADLLRKAEEFNRKAERPEPEERAGERKK